MASFSALQDRVCFYAYLFEINFFSNIKQCGGGGYAMKQWQQKKVLLVKHPGLQCHRS